MSAKDIVLNIAIAVSAGTGFAGGTIRGTSLLRSAKPASRTLGFITEAQASTMQRIANKRDVTIEVIGSRARGNANKFSDWDYVITGGNSRARNKAFNEIASGRAGGNIGPNGETGKEVLSPKDVYPDEPRVRFEPKGR